jgi:hypothetical protein
VIVMPVKASDPKSVNARQQKQGKTSTTVLAQPAINQAGKQLATPPVSGALFASPVQVLNLQRLAGNRATAQLIQTKLTVGAAGDRYEQEADRVAAQVMAMPASTGPAPETAATQSPAVQRQADEEEIQAKPLASTITPLIQREPAPEEEEVQTKPIAQRAPEEEEELQAKPAVQHASHGEGFEVGGDFEQQLAATRGGGSPLPESVRTFMEPRFGTDFSGVRIHTGSQSAQLNRSVSAQAFTLGQDIYLGQGKDDVESAQGKSLLAHELTHVVQQTGAVQRAPRGVQRAPRHIQRAVGFEFEANYVTKELKPDMKTLSDQDAQVFLPFSHLNLNKQDVILKSKHFELQADELPGGGSDMEFVTTLPPFEENDKGRGQLVDTMKEIKTIGAFLEGEETTYKGVSAAKLSPYGSVVNKRAVIVPSQKTVLSGSPQATVAIRLEQVNKFMADTGADQTGNADPTLQAGRQDLMGMSAGDSVIAGRAAAGAQQALQNFLKSQHGKLFGLTTTSQKLLGLVTLLASYLIRGEEEKLSYAKNIAILMARTDFATQFKLLLPDERAYFKANDGAAFVDLVLQAAGLPGTGAQPLFKQGLNYDVNKKDLLNDLTRGKWLGGIALGVDYLTKKNIGQERGKEMESLGALGKKTEKVGKDKANAPIFELRRIKQSVPYTDWPNLALDIFDYVRALNSGGSATYQRQNNII